MTEKNLITIEGNRLALAFEPDSERIKAIRMLAGSHGGASIATHGGIWRCTLPLTAKDEVARLFVTVKWSDSFRRLAKSSPALLQTSDNVIPDRILAALGDLAKPLEDGRILFKHQIEGVQWLAKNPRAILADDMGLGKTLQALLIARAIYSTTRAHTVVITKASLIDDWRKEATAIAHRVVSCYSWAKIPAPSPGQHYVLIADEAQFAQSLKSQRGEAFQEWAEAADFVILLTGTPLMNGKHENLFPLLKAIGHELGRDRTAYEKRYCARRRITLGGFRIDDDTRRIFWKCKKCGKDNGQAWHYTAKTFSCSACGEKSDAPKTWIDKSGSSNADELREKIAPVILRRLKSKCLDLPPKTRIMRPVEVTKKMDAFYAEAVERARISFLQRVAAGAVQLSGLAFSTLAIVRRAASFAKVEAAIELAEEAIEEGLRPIVFAEYVDTVKAVSAHFKVSPYIGETHVDRKVRIVQDFQEGKDLLFVGTREAGGTGLNLTAGNTIVAIDRALRPGDIDQAEDRAQRIGQKSNVTSYWLRAFPVCLKIDDMIATKRRNIDRVLGEGAGGENEEEESASDCLASLFDWAKQKNTK